jgi:hypothetical protein
MSNISNQLVKDTYNYVLQSDLFTGIVYRIGGDIPINPWFQSGLTISGGFKFSDSPQTGYVLTSDASGNASWQPVSAATGNYLSISGGTLLGNLVVQGSLTANTISATTYYGLPSSLSGVTSVGGGYSVLSGISASTIVLYTLSGTNGVDIVQSGNTILLSSPIDILNGGTY